MHKVHGYSYCNLAARDSADGLWPQSGSGPPAAEDVDFVRYRSDVPMATRHHHILVGSGWWEEGVHSSPLNKRGWVLQERVLAKRVIHFGKTQLFWECCELDAAEICPDDLPDFMRVFESTGFKGFQQIKNVAVLQDHWRRIVETYSDCQLTRPEDRLIAIAGIANCLNEHLQDDYVAGTWRRTLAIDLFWYVVQRQHSSRAVKYRAPTWSWASVDDRIWFHRPGNSNMLFEIKDVYLDHVTDDRMGLLRGSFLLLQGVIKPIENTGKVWTVEGGRMDSHQDHIHLDVLPDSGNEDNPEQSCLYCMRGGSGDHYLFMLLLRCENPATGTFSRIGISLHYKNWDILLARHPNESSLPCVSWNEETRKHTIRVI